MADISKIELLDGSVYNIKDAAARESIPEMATALPQMDGEASAGTSEKYAKEDHVHPSDDNKLDNFISTLSGAIVSFSDGADGLPIKSLTAQINPVQDLHGYDNPWPAGGGKNKFNIDGTKVANKYIAADGTYTNSDVACIYTDPIPVQPNTTYTAFGNSAVNAYIRVAEYTSGDVFVTRSLSGSSYYPKVTFTTSANTAFLRISPDTSVAKIQVEQGSGQQYTPYVIDPYSNLCPISGWTGCNIEQRGKNLLPNKKYQGSSKYVYLGQDRDKTYFDIHLKPGTYSISCNNIVSASLYYKEATGSSILISSANTNNYGTIEIDIESNYQFWLYWSNGISVDDVTQFQLELGSTASTYKQYQGETLSISWSDTAGTAYGGNIVVNDDGSGVLTVDMANIASYAGETISGEWISDRDVYALGTTPTIGAQVVYPLATPLTYNLTAEQLTTLLGTNNIWVDTGDASVTYYNQNLDTLFVNDIKALTGKVNIAQGTANAGKFLVVGSDGNVTTVTMTAWQGGSY